MLACLPRTVRNLKSVDNKFWLSTPEAWRAQKNVARNAAAVRYCARKTSLNYPPPLAGEVDRTSDSEETVGGNSPFRLMLTSLAFGTSPVNGGG
jgi:hypothetical protein